MGSNVDALSAKTETKVENQRAVLKATAQRIDDQTNTLQRRLSLMDWELEEKNDEIARLRRAVRSAEATLVMNNEDLGALQKRCDDQGLQVQQLALDAERLSQESAMKEWHGRVKAKIKQEDAEAALVRDRRVQAEEVKALDQETHALRLFVSKMEDRCKRQVTELERHRRRYEALKMEESLCVFGNRMGIERAQEHFESSLAEKRTLRARLGEESVRRADNEPHAKAHDAREASTIDEQRELIELAACMREVSRALHFGPGDADDAIDASMAAFLRSARDFGEVLPVVLRVGPGEYLIGPELVQCVLIQGRLNVRQFDGRFQSLGDFLKSRRREHALAASSTMPLAAVPPLGAALETATLPPLGTAAPLPVPVQLPRSRSATPGPIDVYSPRFVRRHSPRSGSAQRAH